MKQTSAGTPSIQHGPQMMTVRDAIGCSIITAILTFVLTAACAYEFQFYGVLSGLAVNRAWAEGWRDGIEFSHMKACTFDAHSGFRVTVSPSEE